MVNLSIWQELLKLQGPPSFSFCNFKATEQNNSEGEWNDQTETTKRYGRPF